MTCKTESGRGAARQRQPGTGAAESGKPAQRLGELLEQMQQTVEEAETAEPLLAQKLYDSFRKTQQRQVDQQLRDTAELLRADLIPRLERSKRVPARASTS